MYKEFPRLDIHSQNRFYVTFRFKKRASVQGAIGRCNVIEANDFNGQCRATGTL